MKKLQKLKLHEISRQMVEKEQQNVIRGGVCACVCVGCGCGCLYDGSHGPNYYGGSSSNDNYSANSNYSYGSGSNSNAYSNRA